MMYYPCGKFGDCSFSRFGSIVQTHIDADERFFPATHVSVSNNNNNNNKTFYCHRL